MNTKKLIDKLTDNLGPKVVCLILAILLYIFNQVLSLDRKAYTIPLQVEANGLMMPYSNIPKYVRVYVRTNPENLAAINSSSFIASIDLDNYTEAGEYIVPVNVSPSPNLLLLQTLEYSVHPEAITVDLDEKILRYVPVKPAYSGSVAHGYEISAADISPSTVKVAGPSRILEKVKYIDTRKVNINGASTSLTQEVRLDNMNPKLNVLPEGDFKVTVTITPAAGEKELKDLIPQVIGLSEKLELAEKLAPVTIKLAGTIPVLDEYMPDENILWVDLKDVTEAGTYELPLNIRIPQNIAVQEQSAESVTVVVKEVNAVLELEDEKSESVETDSENDNEPAKETAG